MTRPSRTCQHCEFYTGGECANPVVTDALALSLGDDFAPDGIGLTPHFRPQPEFSCSGFTPFLTRMRESPQPPVVQSRVGLRWARL